MVLYPAVIIHGLPDARGTLARGEPVTLLSAPGAALYAGALWWKSLIAAAHQEFPDRTWNDVLDCADATGQALAAIRVGVVRLVLWPEAPGWAAIDAMSRGQGGFVLGRPPPLLPLAD